jgi:triosephosphate isomerase (TIM)
LTPDVRPLVAGNWKMHGLTASLGEIEAMRKAADAGAAGQAELLVCPPFTLLAQAAAMAKDGKLSIGAQDCHPEPNGAYTGDISAPMLKDAGAAYVIVGHSERRTMHQETDAVVRAKANAALKSGLTVIVCVGETRTEREAGETRAIISRQLHGSLPRFGTPETMIVAYEPIWAIGTGLIPTPAYVTAMHDGIRELLVELYGASGAKMRILYGGSVKPANANDLLGLVNVDGALIGGASLKAADFLAIAALYT